LTSIERRIAPRVSVSLPITFETEDGSIYRGTIENLSETGMLIVAEEQIPLETSVRIMFSKHYEDIAIELRGHVVRSSPLGQVGVAFIEVGETAREVVRKAMMREL
jgi:c-di-GMP-binding flagellar brake protein YcgR